MKIRVDLPLVLLGWHLVAKIETCSACRTERLVLRGPGKNAEGVAWYDVPWSCTDHEPKEPPT